MCLPIDAGALLFCFLAVCASRKVHFNPRFGDQIAFQSIRLELNAICRGNACFQAYLLRVEGLYRLTSRWCFAAESGV